MVTLELQQWSKHLIESTFYVLFFVFTVRERNVAQDVRSLWNFHSGVG